MTYRSGRRDRYSPRRHEVEDRHRALSVVSEDHVVPMPDAAGWTEDARLASIAAIRARVEGEGGQIVAERRVRNATFDRAGQRTTWTYTVRFGDQ